jgi:hypothetical protein
VNRIKLNWLNAWDWYEATTPVENWEAFPMTTRVGKNDIVTRQEMEGWRSEKGIDELRDVIESFHYDLEDEGFKELWPELGRVVGERKLGGVWPATLILATRKRSTQAGCSSML